MNSNNDSSYGGLFSIEYDKEGRAQKPNLPVTLSKNSPKIINDFGEHIGGARKEDAINKLTYASLASMSTAEMGEDIVKSKIWKSSLEHLKEAGLSSASASFLLAIKRSVGSFPKITGDDKQNRTTIETYFKTVKDIQSVWESVNKDMSIEDISDVFKEHMTLYSNMKRYTNSSAHETELGKEARLSGALSESIYGLIHGADEKKIENFKSLEWSDIEKKAKKVVAPVINESSKSIIKKAEYLEDVQRVSDTEWREGDISEKDLLECFKFRGGEFGNWMSQEERQIVLNHAFDSFMDLSKALKINPSSIGLNGTLAIAFGSRGRGGGASAHYEPGRKVINLTKPRGAGSLAHEWFHAYDNYLSSSVKSLRTSLSYASESHNIKMNFEDDLLGRVVVLDDKSIKKLSDKDDTLKAFAAASYFSFSINYKGVDSSFGDNLLHNIKDGKIPNMKEALEKMEEPRVRLIDLDRRLKRKRKAAREVIHKKQGEIREEFGERDFSINARKLDNQKGSRSAIYWSTDREKSARCFEVMVGMLLREKGIKNDYLVNPMKLKEDAYGKLVDNGLPYPVGKERGEFLKIFHSAMPTMFNDNVLDAKIQKDFHVKKLREQNLIISLTGTRGAGKSSAAGALKEKYGDNIYIAISDTTREPRENEVDGVDYNFVSKEVFLENISAGKMVESTEFGGELYGTPFTELQKDVPVVVVVDPIGAKLIEYEYKLTKVWIDADIDVRQERMEERGGEERTQKEIKEDSASLHWKVNGLEADYSVIGEENTKELLEILDRPISEEIQRIKEEKEKIAILVDSGRIQAP